jgi:hypothetical protein
VESKDPYRTCEQHCNHDLARAVTVEELLSGDGPYPPSQILVNLSFDRATLFSDDLEEIRAEADRLITIRSSAR